MDDPVADFQAITGANQEQAAHFLQGSGGDLEQAIENYYAAEEKDTMDTGAAPPAPPARPASAASQSSTSQKKAAPKAPSKFRTLADMAEPEEDDSEDEKNGERTYAGGTSSGLSVQQPGKGKKTNEEFTKEILEKARERGAIDYQDWKKESEGPFKGAGYRLGSEQTAPGTHKPLKETMKKERQFSIKFWNDGFSVDDGPLRKLDDPESQDFMESVNKGEIPRELHRQISAEMDPSEGPPKIIVNLEQKNKNYEAPPKSFSAFTGSGHSLSSGSSAPAPVDDASIKPKSSKGHEVDDSKPVTTIQIRLADGTRLQVKFNLTHTIEDIREFINRSKPQQRAYDIICTMPRQVFSDGKQTIEAAGLKNASVVQHLI